MPKGGSFSKLLKIINEFFMIFSLIFILPIPIYTAKQNLFLIEKVIVCPNDHELMVHIQNWTTSNKANVVTVNGVFEVTEIIKGPIALELTVERCNVQRTRCDKLPPIILPDICNSFNTQLMGPNLLSRVKPKLRCPIKPNNYTLENMLVEMKEFAKIPFEECRLKPTIKFLMMKKNKKVLAACIGANVRLTVSSSRKN